ncbi:MAG TPA: 5-amino-6-(D-ribitylamino)uracil--L-tyrosine 4-hydroxyphenyl transferase CofH [Bradyrhizobium sp.]|uniref:5-amino-6-(D-ribitylamino)uracil--L-tyrosine 4-hydroxyphenyl transferase CofH n=1 Tax=Bradyrhizobium sp. TaxID=376 RepID=UPI002BE1E606|nr:5-amino-6-(D-ribitylamino)uracil--L-tyrosine 4-hydroxyphenyl transferase CofH [Bradyrhizobium sp.]HTB03171.1 5-amino-6-(D-ribitylamino)uracil--L-tyrosine 4-hydroxyphenyl transferase CofH [Bradyrhizobium sp.]
MTTSGREARRRFDAPLAELMTEAAALRDSAHGRLISYSRKVFIPLTKLCRDVCHYCTFAQPPRAGKPVYLSPDEVLAIARAGAAAGCTEALFTLGDKPELRYQAAREALKALGHETTISYLTAMCALVLRETGLLPHANPGVMTREEIAALREVTASQGIMLESASERLCRRGGVHYGSPDKHPAVRLETLRLAGELKVPFTTGILIGIGETRDERIDALRAIRDLHAAHGHIQEVIVQNFRAKPDTKLANSEEPDLDDLLWTIATARLVLGPEMNIQAPPNLSPGVYQKLVGAGLNDWGGISPVTPDHVNPEAPWPAIAELARKSADVGKLLVNRLAVYPAYLRDADTWLAPGIATRARRMSDAEGFARDDDWEAGNTKPPPAPLVLARGVDARIAGIVERVTSGERLASDDIVRLFAARDADYRYVTQAADALRRAVSGDVVRYVVNRNINYTNICYYRCKFCAFSKGRTHEDLRGSPYDLAIEEITRRAIEAWDRGASEVCLQGGIHPDYTGATYEAICRAIKAVVPGMHIHAFSALEVTQGAATLGLPIPAFLAKLKAAGLGTLPGTAAEILDDDVRAIICPDKINTGQWLEVQREAHRAGLRTTSTIMYGHVETSSSWAKHLLALRDLQAETGGFTEFVPLPFVHMEAPMYRLGMARPGPTFREAVLMHSVARLALHPLIPNIQTSWVKMGPAGAAICLKSGANDLGGTLMNESISRAAGTQHGQEFPPHEMEALIRSIGRDPMQRDTLYRQVAEDRRAASMIAADLEPIVLTPPRKKAAVG